MTSLDPLLTKSEVADLVSKDLRLSYRHVYDRYISLPGFPKPVKIESALGHKPRLVWVQSAIIRFLSEKRMAA